MSGKANNRPTLSGDDLKNLSFTLGKPLTEEEFLAMQAQAGNSARVVSKIDMTQSRRKPRKDVKGPSASVPPTQ